MVDVVAKTAACTAAHRLGRHSADSVCAGRPFFIRIGVSQASEAPGGEQRVQDAGPQPRVQVVDVGLEDDGGPAGAGVAPARPAPAGRRSAARPGRGRRRPCRRARPASAAASSTRPPGARRGPRRWACTSRPAPAPATTGTPASSSSTAGPGIGTTPCAPRAEPLPSATGRGGQPGQPEVLEPGDDADDVGQRVERADLVEVHLVGGDPVHAALGDGQPLEHRQGAVADGRCQGGARRAAPGRRPRCGGAADSAARARAPGWRRARAG